jgi:hypothetical protein
MDCLCRFAPQDRLPALAINRGLPSGPRSLSNVVWERRSASAAVAESSAPPDDRRFGEELTDRKVSICPWSRKCIPEAETEEHTHGN